MPETQPVLIAGEWRDSDAVGSFEPMNPKTMSPTGESYPVSGQAEIEEAVTEASRVSEELGALYPGAVADFLNRFAAGIESNGEKIVEKASEESGLPATPRLSDIELPRTTDQLRQAAAAARDQSWSEPTIDTAAGIRSMFRPLGGGVAVFGPNNFPFAFNSVSGGDFAAAIAAGNPVIGKANSSHPGTTRLLAEVARSALDEAGLPPATVQLVYRTDHEVGKRLVSHPLIGATGYTGSRQAGLVLKAAADRAGTPIYLELSSINPVVLLPGALRERGAEIAAEFATSCLMGTGQFCTNPGVVMLLAGNESDSFIESVTAKFDEAPVGTLLNEGVQTGLEESVKALQEAGAELLTGGTSGGGTGYSYGNTILKVSGRQFLDNAEELQSEAFGNESLFVVAADVAEAAEVARRFEGNLTGAVYSELADGDEAAHDIIAPILRQRVGRLLNDKMPTGVAVSAAMNHGGPFPATGHAGFTAVGIPGSLRRFTMLQCFDNVREHRLPPELRNVNPGDVWRRIDGTWTQGDVPVG